MSLVSPPGGLTTNQGCCRGAGICLYTILTNNVFEDSWALCEVECFMDKSPGLFGREEGPVVPKHCDLVFGFQEPSLHILVVLSANLMSQLPKDKGGKHTSIISGNITVWQQNYCLKRWPRVKEVKLYLIFTYFMNISILNAALGFFIFLYYPLRTYKFSTRAVTVSNIFECFGVSPTLMAAFALLKQALDAMFYLGKSLWLQIELSIWRSSIWEK